MQPASRLLAHFNDLNGTLDSPAIVCAAWARAVGKKIAEHSRPVKMVRDTLVIEVEDAMWQRNLRGLSKFILKNLEKRVGAGIVTDLEFRVMPLRLGPQRAEASIPAFELAADEADSIADPGLRRIYIRQRRKETA